MNFELTSQLFSVLWIIIGVLIMSLTIHVAMLIGDKFDKKEDDDYDDYEGFGY